MRHLTPFVFIAYTWNTSRTCTFIENVSRYESSGSSLSSPPTKKSKKLEFKMYQRTLKCGSCGWSWRTASLKRSSPGVSNTSKCSKMSLFVGTLMYLFVIFLCVMFYIERFVLGLQLF